MIMHNNQLADEIVALCIGIFLTRSYKACSNPGGDVVLASAIVVIAIAKVATKLNWLAGILSVKQIAVGLLDCLDLVGQTIQGPVFLHANLFRVDQREYGFNVLGLSVAQSTFDLRAFFLSG